jgi:hypothetical protein
MKMAVSWVVVPCSLVDVYQRFRGPCCLHHSSGTLVNFYQTTRCYNPEDNRLRIHRRENLKSYFNFYVSDNFPFTVGTWLYIKEIVSLCTCIHLAMPQYLYQKQRFIKVRVGVTSITPPPTRGVWKSVTYETRKQHARRLQKKKKNNI